MGSQDPPQRVVTGFAKDLEAADRLAPKEANLRCTLAVLYFEADEIPASIAQLDLRDCQPVVKRLRELSRDELRLAQAGKQVGEAVQRGLIL